MARRVAGVEVIGRWNLENTLTAIRHRLENPEGAAQQVYRVFEHEYDRKFAEWNGYLVDTGALKDSLTWDGPHALREAHHLAIEFGTKLPYARFHQGALLDIRRDVYDEVADALADYVMPQEIVSGYFATRHTREGPKKVFIASYARRRR
jgi:hypothetical protein